MAKEWTAQEVREWLLRVLYDIYMQQSPTARASFGSEGFPQATDEYPSWKDIYREAEWLSWKGLIEAEFGPTSIEGVKITPAGREYVEKELLKPTSGK